MSRGMPDTGTRQVRSLSLLSVLLKCRIKYFSKIVLKSDGFSEYFLLGARIYSYLLIEYILFISGARQKLFVLIDRLNCACFGCDISVDVITFFNFDMIAVPIFSGTKQSTTYLEHKVSPRGAIIRFSPLSATD